MAQHIHLHAVARIKDAQHAVADVQALAQGRRQALGEPAIAFGPGEGAGFAFGPLARFPGGMETMAAGEVVDAGPGRHAGQPGTVVVAAAVVEVPAQVRVIEALGAQPGVGGEGVQCGMVGGERSQGRRDAEAAGPLQRRHARGEAVVLRQRGLAHTVHGQQAILPGALKEQALLRAVHQVALVIAPAPGHALAQAQLFQQILHLAGVVAGDGQVVRAQRAGDAAHLAAPGVATGAVFQLQQHKVFDATLAQRTGRRQPGHAAAGDQHLGAARGLRRRRLMHIAQRMATLVVDAGEAAFDGRRPLAACQRQRGRQAEKSAALHQWLGTLPHSCSYVVTNIWFDKRFTSAGTCAISSGKSNSSGKVSGPRKRSPAGRLSGCRQGRRLAMM